MPQISTTPTLAWAAGARQPVTVTVAPPAGHTLAEFDSFVLTARGDPLFGSRSGRDADRLADPIGDGWAVAATAAGTPDADAGTVAFVVTVPDAPGYRRYAVDVWGLGGSAGPVQLVSAVWLSVTPRVSALS